MIYFYAGLGAAMLTGIMLLFDVGLALTGQSLLEERSDFDAYQDVVNGSDRLFQEMLTQPQDLQAIGTGRYGSDLCTQIMCRIQSPGIGCRSGNSNNPRYEGLDYVQPILDYSTPRITPAIGMWASCCALERFIDCDPGLDPGCANANYIHRILIRPSRDRLDLGYELYSCIVERKHPDSRCLFERGA